jgi:tungstate transport system ATP-binding protein
MSPPPVFRLEGVRRGYGGAFHLDLPQFDVAAGECLAVLGPTGAGKSTLLRLLHLLEPPDAGTISFDGAPVPHPAPLDIRRSITMVFQRPLMFSGSVRDNVAIGLRWRSRVEARSVDGLLERFDLAHLARREARMISGGEMQRLAMARAMATRPRALLLDEPAASLDPGHVGAIEGIIRRVHRDDGTTIVLATHNIGQARRLADRVGLLVAGRLIEIAETSAFFERPRDPLTAAYLRGDLLTEGSSSP